MTLPRELEQEPINNRILKRDDVIGKPSVPFELIRTKVQQAQRPQKDPIAEAGRMLNRNHIQPIALVDREHTTSLNASFAVSIYPLPSYATNGFNSGPDFNDLDSSIYKVPKPCPEIDLTEGQVVLIARSNISEVA